MSDVMTEEQKDKIGKILYWGLSEEYRQTDFRLEFITQPVKDRIPSELLTHLIATVDNNQLYTHEVLKIGRLVKDIYHSFNIKFNPKIHKFRVETITDYDDLTITITGHNRPYEKLLIDYHLYGEFEDGPAQDFPVKVVDFPARQQVDETVYFVRDCPVYLGEYDTSYRIDIMFISDDNIGFNVYHITLDNLLPWTPTLTDYPTELLRKKRIKELAGLSVNLDRLYAIVNLKCVPR